MKPIIDNQCDEGLFPPARTSTNAESVIFSVIDRLRPVYMTLHRAITAPFYTVSHSVFHLATRVCVSFVHERENKLSLSAKTTACSHGRGVALLRVHT